MGSWGSREGEINAIESPSDENRGKFEGKEDGGFAGSLKRVRFQAQRENRTASKVWHLIGLLSDISQCLELYRSCQSGAGHCTY